MRSLFRSRRVSFWGVRAEGAVCGTQLALVTTGEIGNKPPSLVEASLRPL